MSNADQVIKIDHAYDQGYAAGEMGLSADFNEYPIGTIEHEMWNDGHEAATEDLENE